MNFLNDFKLQIFYSPHHYDSRDGNQGQFYSFGLTLVQEEECIHIPTNVWENDTYQFPNFNSCTVEVWELTSNLIPHFITDIIIHTCWESSQSVLVNWEQ